MRIRVRYRILGVAGLVLLISVTIFHQIVIAPHSALYDVLAHDEPIELKWVGLGRYERKQVRSDDPVVCGWFEKVLSAPKLETTGHIDGQLTYVMTAGLTWGRSVTFSFYLDPDLSGAVVYDSPLSLAEPQYYMVEFPADLPPAVQAMFEQLIGKEKGRGSTASCLHLSPRERRTG